jgi:xanthine dehydrogenase accessory factor
VDKNAIVTSNQDDMQGLSVVMKSSESDQIHPSLEGCCPIIFVDGQKIDLGRVPESSLVQTAGEKIYVSALDVKGTVYIFGAGHVSQKLALITGMVGFRTVIVDDRAEFASTARFPSADQVMVVPDYDHLFEKIKLDAESYLVIVTRGHLYDKTVLAQAVKQEVIYTGMIGSKRKKEAVFKALLEEGITSDQLERVHSPIGLSIGAESPEEIAVSIVAELIKTRSEYYFRS